MRVFLHKCTFTYLEQIVPEITGKYLAGLQSLVKGVELKIQVSRRTSKYLNVVSWGEGC